MNIEFKYNSDMNICLQREDTDKYIYIKSIEDGIRIEYTDKHGSWKGLKPDNRGYTEKFQCSECKCITTLYLYRQECDYEYCPNCGAKMDLEE